MSQGHESHRGQPRDPAAAFLEWVTRPLGHRGYWHALQLFPQSGYREHVVGNAKIEFEASDAYWGRLRSRRYRYEPEVARLLSAIGDKQFAFVDVGANIGYWSAYVAANLRPSQVVSVEPNPALFELLSRNVQKNIQDPEMIWTPLIAAVAVTGRGKTLLRIPLHAGGHASASISRQFAEPYSIISVETVAPVDLLGRVREGGQTVVLKIDIEGSEAEILESLSEGDIQNVVLVYEDHGSDEQGLPTQSALKFDWHEVFLLEGQTAYRIRDVERLQIRKSRAHVGYNCVAIPFHLVKSSLRTFRIVGDERSV